MNHGSIESRSSASALDFRELHAPYQRTPAHSEGNYGQFESIFERFRQDDASSRSGSDIVEREAKTERESEISDREHEPMDDSEVSAEHVGNSRDQGEQTRSESSTREQSKESKSERLSNEEGKAKGETEHGQSSHVGAENADRDSGNGKAGAAGKQEQQGKLSSTMHLRLAAKTGDAGKATTEGKATKGEHAAGEQGAAASMKKGDMQSVLEKRSLSLGSQAKLDGSDKGVAAKGKAAAGESKALQASVDAKVKSTGDGEVMPLPESKGTNRPAKTTRASLMSEFDSQLMGAKNALKSLGMPGEARSRSGDPEFGIKVAQQSAMPVHKMNSEPKSADFALSEKGFLKAETEQGTQNRASAVQSRSDGAGLTHQGQSGMGGQSDAGGNSRGGEQMRQWIESTQEVKSVSQSAQQTELVDRNAASMLSARVLNQIVNHIERMRDSGKNRVKVSLGEEAEGISVDIRIDGGAVVTVFEGESRILDQLKEDWSDIRRQATRRGVTLRDPEFVKISHSSSEESNGVHLDGNPVQGKESQSVLQEQQSVRAESTTAATGRSGPVHSYA